MHPDPLSILFMLAHVGTGLIYVVLGFAAIRGAVNKNAHFTAMFILWCGIQHLQEKLGLGPEWLGASVATIMLLFSMYAAKLLLWDGIPIIVEPPHWWWSRGHTARKAEENKDNQ